MAIWISGHEVPPEITSIKKQYAQGASASNRQRMCVMHLKQQVNPSQVSSSLPSRLSFWRVHRCVGWRISGVVAWSMAVVSGDPACKWSPWSLEALLFLVSSFKMSDLHELHNFNILKLTNYNKCRYISVWYPWNGEFCEELIRPWMRNWKSRRAGRYTIGAINKSSVLPWMYMGRWHRKNSQTPVLSSKTPGNYIPKAVGNPFAVWGNILWKHK